MKTFMLVVVLFTDGGSMEYIKDTGLSLNDCLDIMEQTENTFCITE